MRLVDSNSLLKKWGNLSERGRTEFDQVIMCEPTFEVENNLEVYTVMNTTGDPNSINVFTFHVDPNGDMALDMNTYTEFYRKATDKLPECVSTCLIPDTMTAEIWDKKSLQSYIEKLQELLEGMDK